MDAFVHQKMHSVKIKYTLHIDFVWEEKEKRVAAPT